MDIKGLKQAIDYEINQPRAQTTAPPSLLSSHLVISSILCCFWCGLPRQYSRATRQEEFLSHFKSHRTFVLRCCSLTFYQAPARSACLTPGKCLLQLSSSGQDTDLCPAVLCTAQQEAQPSAAQTEGSQPAAVRCIHKMTPTEPCSAKSSLSAWESPPPLNRSVSNPAPLQSSALFTLLLAPQNWPSSFLARNIPTELLRVFFCPSPKHKTAFFIQSHYWPVALPISRPSTAALKVGA